MEPLLLDVKDLNVFYGNVNAVQNINLKVKTGEIVSIIGPNGAGKTTLLSAIMGRLSSSGSVYYQSEGLTANEGIAYRVSRGMCLVPESRELFSEMTVEDNLQLGAFTSYLKGKRDYRRLRQEIYELFPRLGERAKQLAGTLSGGERQMLAMGRALMAQPKLLMLDEPSLGLAPLVVKEILHIVAALRTQGVSILLVEQNARAALEISDYGYVMETGQIAVKGRAEALANDPQVVDAYLGRQSN